MSNFGNYLERQQPPLVIYHTTAESDHSSLFVTIPCFDEPELISSLESLAACDPPSSSVTVIVVVNASENSSPEFRSRNHQTVADVLEWWCTHPKPFYQLKLLEAPSLPAKWAGVGWARKIAMDEAINCLQLSGKEEGILVAFDADSTVSTNYFKAIESAFINHPRYQFVNLNFIHPIDEPTLSASLKEGIILYELYLRYLRNAMKWSGYPHSIHTVGSSFAVKASAYVKQGGMNRRQAGEDFHFLHKIVMLGEYGSVHEATVYPAARISHRVPFGTGAALKRWEEGDEQLYKAYSLGSFQTLQPLFKDPSWFFTNRSDEWDKKLLELDPFLQEYISRSGTVARLRELKNNCSDSRTFTKRFYHEVNAFWIIQYLNQRESTEGGVGHLVEESRKLLKELGAPSDLNLNTRELLEVFRQLDLQE